MEILLPLAITLGVETGIYMILKRDNLKLFIVVSIMNMILNVSMNTGLFFVTDSKLYSIILVCSEVATVLIESLIVYLFTKIKYWKTLLFAFLANLASFIVGWLLTFLYKEFVPAVIGCCVFLLIYLVVYIVTLLKYIKSLRQTI